MKDKRKAQLESIAAQDDDAGEVARADLEKEFSVKTEKLGDGVTAIASERRGVILRRGMNRIVLGRAALERLNAFARRSGLEKGE